MNIGKSFVLALALGTGLAAPFFVFAGGDEAVVVTAETRERVERALEQMRSDTPIVRQAGESSLANESAGSLALLREHAEKAKADGNADLERRIKDAISKIEEREGINKPEAPKAQDGRRAEGGGNTWRVELGGMPGAARSHTFIENGKVTKIEQDREGKITLTITEPGSEPVREEFADRAAFEAKHPDLAKRFGEGGMTYRIVPPTPFRGPWGEPGDKDTPGQEEADPFRRIEDLFGGLGQLPGSRQGLSKESQESLSKQMESVKAKQAELRSVIDDPVAARGKLAELEAETKRLEDTISGLGRAAPGNVPVPADPFERMRKMMEDMWKVPGLPGGGEGPAPGSQEWLDDLRRRAGWSGPEEGERVPGAEKQPWKGGEEPSGDSGKKEPEKLPGKPSGVPDDN